MRCFLGTKIDEDLVPEVRDIKEKFKRTGGDIKFVEDENLHFTVKFLGDIGKDEIKEVDAVKEVVENFDPFEIGLVGTGVFPSLDYMKVIWIGVEDGKGEFTDLLQQIEDRLSEKGFEREKNEIVPHATIGRVKSGKNKKQVSSMVERLKGEKIGEMVVDKVTLFESELTPEGPIYKKLKNYTL